MVSGTFVNGPLPLCVIAISYYEAAVGQPAAEVAILANLLT